MSSITVSRIAAFRLQRHAFHPRRADLAEVVAAVGGIQAQLMSAAHLAIGARLERCLPADVEKALWEDRSLVKTWTLRGTVHLVAARDLPLHTTALAVARARQIAGWVSGRHLSPSDEAQVASEQRELLRGLARRGISVDELERITEAIVESLSARPITRKQLAVRVETALGPLGAVARAWIENGWGSVLKLAAIRGQLCHGPSQGTEATFVRVDQWVPGVPSLDADAARLALLRRYLAAYGPATPADFASWVGLNVADIRADWKGLEGDLAEVRVDGRKLWLLSEDLPMLASAEAPETCRLLPHFDCFVLGHKDKTHVLEATHHKHVFRPSAWVAPVVLVDGRVAGVWSSEQRRQAVSVKVKWFQEGPRRLRALLDQEVKRLRDWMGREVRLEVEEPG